MRQALCTLILHRAVSMDIILVNGFLGSGKTTGIARASQQLQDAGHRVAVVTNDQGTDLVDTNYLRSLGLETQEVTGACFCCHFAELESRLVDLIESFRPTVLFAESVGSCTDLVATVVKPLLQKYPAMRLSVSVFADASLVLKIFQGQASFLTDHIRYIFQKQLEEADLIFLNKADLLEAEQTAELTDQFKAIYPSKHVHVGSALEDQAIVNWLDRLPELSHLTNREALDIDYDKYAAGEADLGWLNVLVTIEDPKEKAIQAAQEFIAAFRHNLLKHQLQIGHVKCLIDTHQGLIKINFTSSTQNQSSDFPTGISARNVKILVNARVLCPPDQLQDQLMDAMDWVEDEHRVTVSSGPVTAFSPSYPSPTYRLS